MEEAMTGFKLLLSYDVRPENVQEYYRFMLGRYVPVMQAMGLEMSDAWHTAYGDQPNRLVGFVAQDEETMADVLDNETWTSLNQELQRFVVDFSYKVIPYEEGFQI